MLRRLRRNCPVPRTSVRAPSRARPSPKKSEPLVEPTWRLAAFARAPALSTTRPREIRLTPVLTHESSVRSLARCSRTSVWPCSAPLSSSLTRSDLPPLEDYTLERRDVRVPLDFLPQGQSPILTSGGRVFPSERGQ